MNEFKVLLQAALDVAKSKTNIQSDLDKIDDLSLKISKLDINKNALKTLKDSLTKSKFDLNLNLGNIGQIQNSAKKIGQNVGELISDAAQSSINNISSNALNKYFQIDKNTSKNFEKEMASLVNAWTNAKGELTNIKLDTKTAYDENAKQNITSLNKAVVTYKNDLNEIIKKTIEWKQISIDSDNKEIFGFVESAGQYSKAVDSVNTKTDTFIEKQKRAKASLETTLESIKSRVADKNTSKPIVAQSNLEELSRQYKIVEEAIQAVGVATKTSFVDMQSEAEKQIAKLRDMEREYRNAENVATSLRTKDFKTVKEVEIIKLQEFIEKIKGSNVPLDKMQSEINELNAIINNSFDATSLVGYLNKFDIVSAKFKQLNTEIASANRKEKVAIDVSGLSSKIADLQRISPEIKSFKTQIDSADVSVDSLIEDLSSINSQGDFSVINKKFKAFVDSAKAAGIAVSELEQSKLKVNTVNDDLFTEKSKTKILELQNAFQKYGSTVEEANDKVQKLNDIYKSLSSANTEADKIEQYQLLQREISATTNKLKQQKLEYDKFSTPASASSVASTQIKLQKFLSNNTKITKEAKTELSQYLQMLGSGNVSLGALKDIELGLKRVESNMRAVNKLGKSIPSTLLEGAKKFTSWVSSTFIVMQLVQALKTGIKSVINLDTSLVDLNKTTKMSENQLKQFYYSANDVAKQMGVTTKEIIDQVSAWSRLGYSTEAASTQMAKLSSQFKLISPGMTSEEAVKGLVTVMKAYDIEVTDVLDGIMSKVNVVGNNFALENSDIIAMLQDSVSAMAEGNNTLEETIALETAAFEIEQDRSVGNGFKTVSLRLRGLNEETQELDESLTTIKGDLYDLTGVSIMKDANTYKSTYQILKDISGVWDTLTDKKQAEALELMFGKHQANVGAAVLKNFSAAEKAMGEMANSAGNAEAEMSIAIDSIDYKLNTLAQTGVGISQNLFERNDIKVVIDLLISVAEAIDFLTDKLGLFGSSAVVAFGFFNKGKSKRTILPFMEVTPCCKL